MDFKGNQKVQYLELSSIDPDWDNRARGVSENGVESLIFAIEENGFTDPILVRRKGRGDDCRFVLIAGGHRLTAALRLGWDKIPAIIFADITDRRAKFMELGDNLAGKRLDCLEEMEFLTEWQRVFLEEHPEARRGVAGGKARHGQPTAEIAVSSFIDAAVEATGFSKRKIYDRLALGRTLSQDDFKALRSAPNKVTPGDLDALSKLGETEVRNRIIDQFQSGKTPSIREATSALKPSKPSSDPDEAALRKLGAAWKRASMKARRAFIADFYDEISDLTSDEYERREM